MSSPDVNPMISFSYNGVDYQVHMDACNGRGAIKLPDDTFLVVTDCLESYPPQIAEVKVATEGDSLTPRFDATVLAG